MNIQDAISEIPKAIMTTNHPKEHNGTFKKISVFSISGIFILIGVILLTKSLSFISHAKSGVGQIISADQRKNTDGTTMYTPVVEFLDSDGGVRRFRSQISTSNAPLIGKTVSVLFDPNNPNDARLNGFFSLYIIPIFLIGFGLIILLFSSIPLLISTRVRSKEKTPEVNG